MTVRAVCFDLDGTLLRDDYIESVVRAVAVELAQRHPGIDAARLAAANARAWEDVWHEMGVAWLRGEVSHDEVPSEIWRRALAAVGVTDAATSRDAHLLHVDIERAAFAVYPEVPGVLAELRRRGIRTAIVTNGSSGLQRRKLAAVGLAEALDVVIVSGEVGVFKPDPAIFAPALDALGTAPGETLHVGDSLAADIAGARAAGLTAVWINRDGADASAEPHAVVTDLDELVALLEPAR